MMVVWMLKIQEEPFGDELTCGLCRYSVRVCDTGWVLSSRSKLSKWMLACGVDFDNLPEFKDPENILLEIGKIMARAAFEGREVEVLVGDQGVAVDVLYLGVRPEVDWLWSLQGR